MSTGIINMTVHCLVRSVIKIPSFNNHCNNTIGINKSRS